LFESRRRATQARQPLTELDLLDRADSVAARSSGGF
jgi:hypothetical protein